MSDFRYVISYFVESKKGVLNEQRLFNTYDEAVDFGREISRACNIKSVCLETLIVRYSETSVLKD